MYLEVNSDMVSWNSSDNVKCTWGSTVIWFLGTVVIIVMFSWNSSDNVKCTLGVNSDMLFSRFNSDNIKSCILKIIIIIINSDNIKINHVPFS